MNSKYTPPDNSSDTQSCWCGNTKLDTFSDKYGLCRQCQTLVSLQPPSDKQMTADTDDGIYGKEYFKQHYLENSNAASTAERLRQDLRGRNLYWLKSLLKHKLPGTSVLEIGCGHGGFVAAMQQAGFEATGLELSPWLAELANKTFGISILKGKVEEQNINKGKLDAIAMMDVIEHLPDPISTIKHCISLLKSDGIMIIQTPRYPEGRSYSTLLAETPEFETHLRPSGHIYLYSNQSLRQLLERCGLSQIEFEPAIFSHYDMFAVCSRQPITVNSNSEISEALCRTANGRFMQVMLDIDNENNLCAEKSAKLEADVAYLTERVQKAEAVSKTLEKSKQSTLKKIFSNTKQKHFPDPFPGYTLEEYRKIVDQHIESQPNKSLLEAIRSFNHSQLDEFNRSCPLNGTRLLDIGASPHGYALEHALEQGVSLYVGIGLDIKTRDLVRTPAGNTGMLMPMNALDLKFPTGMFDAVICLSVFEHVSDPAAALEEINRILQPGGCALISFEPVWTCSYGHHLHHFGDCAKLVPPWAHLIWTSEQMRDNLQKQWPKDAPISLDDAINWVYHSDALNRIPLARHRDIFREASLNVEWIQPLPNEKIDETSLKKAAKSTGFSGEDLRTRGLSVLLRKSAAKDCH